MDLGIIMTFASFGIVIFGFLMMFYCMEKMRSSKYKDDKKLKPH